MTNAEQYSSLHAERRLVERACAELERELTSMRARLVEIDDKLGRASDDVAIEDYPALLRNKASSALLRLLILHLYETDNETASTINIIDRAQALGFTIPGKNPSNSITSAIARNGEIFEKPSRGHFRLSDIGRSLARQLRASGASSTYFSAKAGAGWL